MKQLFKTSTFLILGIAMSWLTFSLASDLNTRKNIDNNLENIGIIYRSSESFKNIKISEKELSQIIRQALAENPGTATLNLNVVTVGSRITISGKAEDKGQIESIIQTTLKIPGVKEVISTVVIDPETQLANKGSLL